MRRNSVAARCIALFVSTALALAGLQAPPAHASQLSPDGDFIDWMTDGLFDGTAPDRHGGYRARFREDGGHYTFYHSPEGGTLRRRLQIPVAEGASQLHLNVHADAANPGTVRLRLISPSGEIVTPGVARGNRYDDVRPLTEVLRERKLERPVQRGGEQDSLPLFDLREDEVGMFHFESASSTGLINLRAPEAGNWTVQIITRDAAEFLVSAAVFDDVALATHGSDALPLRSFCTIGMKLVIGIAKIVFTAAVLTELTMVAGIVIVGLAVADLAGLLADVIGDVLIEFYGVDKKAIKKLEYVGLTVSLMANLNLVGKTVAGVGAAINQALGRKGTDAAAKFLCALFGDEKILALGTAEPPAAVEGETYQYTFEVLNSTGKVSLRIKNGRLPVGLSLDAGKMMITGTPAPGTSGKKGGYPFVIRATDKGKTKVEQRLKISVDAFDVDNSNDLVPAIQIDQEQDVPGRIAGKIWIANEGERSSSPGNYLLVWSTTKKLNKGAALIDDLGSYDVIAGGAIFPSNSGKSFNFKTPAALARGATIHVGLIVDSGNTTDEKSNKGNAEKNNTAQTSVKVVHAAPFKVLTPKKGDTLKHGKSARVSWQNSSGKLSNVRIRLLQDGNRKAILHTGDVGFNPVWTWNKVPSKYEGGGFTIEVESLDDASIWAASGVFSIGSEDASLSGKWRLNRTITTTITGTPTDTDRSTFTVDVVHNQARSTADVFFGGVKIGVFALNGNRMTATTFLVETIGPGATGPWEGDLLKATHLDAILQNSGTFTDKRLDFTIAARLTLTPFQDLNQTFRYVATKLK